VTNRAVASGHERAEVRPLPATSTTTSMIWLTSRHLTFFEMAGNFSFGDYFKERAIPLAWEFAHRDPGPRPRAVVVTVHLSDDDAEAIWRDTVGVPAERIQRLDDDNFWKMGDVGPCGPSSEIF
jgi:alanyl-tRNA synthetase